MKQRALIPAAIFAVCAGAGWLAGHVQQPAAAASAAAPIDIAPTKSRRDPARSKSKVPAEVAERLARIRAAQNPEERLRATMQLAYSIPAGEIEKWYGGNWLGEGAQDMESYLFYRVLRMRWMAADAEGLMNYCLRKGAENTSEIAGEWAGKDPAAALAYLDQLKDPARRARFANGIGAALAAADPQLVLSRIPEFHARFTENESYVVSQMIGKMAETTPDLLRAASASWPDSLRDKATVSLAGASLKKDFAAGIASLSGMEKGKSTFLKAVQNNSEVMAEIGKRPDLLPAGWLAGATTGSGSYYLVREDPAKWLAADYAALGLTEQQASQIRNQAISQLGSKDAGQLMSMLSTGKMEGDDRRTAIQSLLSYLPQEKRDAFLATLTDAQEIEMARQVVEQRESRTNKEPVTPASLLAGLAKEGGSLNWEQSRAAGAWTKEQVKGFASEFAALTEEQRAGVAMKLAESHYDEIPREIGVQAVEYLIAHAPPKKEGISWTDESTPATRGTVQLAAKWAKEDPNAASQWVSSLPAGQERLWAAKNVAAQWADYEPKEAARWVATLPEADRKAVQDYLKTGGGRNP